MRLAAHLGMTQGELLARLTSEELSEWIAFDNEYGLPDHYFTTARTCITNVGLWSKEQPRARDFVPYFAPPRERKKQTVADHKAIFQAISKPA